MGIIEYKSKAGKIESLLVESDFPLCTCGGTFEVKDIFTQRGKHWGTSADCKDCDEHFFQDSYDDLKRNIPTGQKARQIKTTYKLK